MYGYLPPRFPTYEPSTTVVAAVDDTLRSRDQILALLRENLQKAQSRMKKFADLKRTEREFKVGDLV